MTGRISCDEPWATVEPRQINPNQTEQVITVSFDPAKIPGDQGVAVVRVVTDRGERADISFEVHQKRSPMVVWVVGLVGVVTVVSAGLWLASAPSSLDIQIEPWATEIVINGQAVGPGGGTHIAEATYPLAISVSHPNFEAWNTTLQGPPADDILAISLKLSNAMTFVPGKPLQNPPLRRVTVPKTEARDIVGARGPHFDACISAAAGEAEVLAGALWVHVGKDGVANGMVLEGAALDKPGVKTCLQRQAAAIVLNPLEGGDYASVRYNYSVTGAPGGT
jgi:hypothetical protein